VRKASGDEDQEREESGRRAASFEMTWWEGKKGGKSETAVRERVNGEFSYSSRRRVRSERQNKEEVKRR